MLRTDAALAELNTRTPTAGVLDFNKLTGNNSPPLAKTV
jgi:hypothetical protein